MERDWQGQERTHLSDAISGVIGSVNATATASRTSVAVVAVVLQPSVSADRGI